MTFVDLYHVGIVVRDLDAAAEELTRLLGLDFARPRAESLRLRTAAGPADCTFRFTYSRGATGPALELIEATPGSPWWPGEGPAVPEIHHLGFWAPDFPERVAALEAGGAPVEVTVRGGAQPRLFTYHRTVHGPRIELVDGARQAEILR